MFRAFLRSKALIVDSYGKAEAMLFPFVDLPQNVEPF
jgi:hypothetical protein